MSGLTDNHTSSHHVSIEVLQQLYSSAGATSGARRHDSSVVYPVTKGEYPAVKRLDPLRKKRVLVTGV